MIRLDSIRISLEQQATRKDRRPGAHSNGNRVRRARIDLDTASVDLQLDLREVDAPAQLGDHNALEFSSQAVEHALHQVVRVRPSRCDLAQRERDRLGLC